MCRIILSFVAGNDIDALSNITYTLSGVRLKGTFNSSDGKAHVDMTAPPTDLTLEVSNAKTMTSSLIFFPGQGGESNKLDLIVTMDGRDYKTTFTPDPNGNDMLGGYSYDCTVKLNKETMTIEEATIKPWDSITNGNIEATN